MVFGGKTGAHIASDGACQRVSNTLEGHIDRLRLEEDGNQEDETGQKKQRLSRRGGDEGNLESSHLHERKLMRPRDHPMLTIARHGDVGQGRCPWAGS